MNKITQIQYDNQTGRVIVYIDYRYCASIRKNVWQKMGLSEGSEISRAELHKKEVIIWQEVIKTNGAYLAKKEELAKGTKR